MQTNRSGIRTPDDRRAAAAAQALVAGASLPAHAGPTRVSIGLHDTQACVPFAAGASRLVSSAMKG
ncbi:hypothetical protein EZH22_15795 [Xanthobacter dioxanivorans]|uniref:Uncharacterized protein n=1 Tax=Xanthobacter dioxanivorans TaxID=2528964 RepID=A0A974PKC0_9HYPH|nr:hypothetical protein [Xanthobacter dioxanivorans]QRG04640.1 hypothetical protein EZH22_15795 [Xanthobacter dioxanivorans]